ncbi:MAG TPA: helix-turn-helix transcriptional regulator [Umezawaea sp.]|nr:helix-turn-helix transcriptional regulator [Umezawaea sp.]
MDGYSVALGRHLANVRDERHLTQVSVANAIGISLGTLRSYEIATGVAPYARLDALAAHYGVTALSLIVDAHRSLTNGDPLTLAESDSALIDRALVTWHAARKTSTTIHVSGQQIGCQDFGRALRDMRQARRISRIDLAGRVGNTAGRLTSAENGYARLTLRELATLASLYGDGLVRLLVRLATRTPRSTSAWPERDVHVIEQALLAWEAAKDTLVSSRRRAEPAPPVSTSRAAYWTRLGDTLRGLREPTGRTPPSVTREADLPRNAVAAFEAAKRRARLSQLDAICRVYRASLLALLAHVADPGSLALRADVGGDGASVIASALVTWDRAEVRTAARYRIGRRMQELRTANGATLDDVTRHLATTKEALMACEDGERRFSLSSMAQLADLYRVPALPLLVHVTSDDARPCLGLGGVDADVIVRAAVTWEAAKARTTSTQRRELMGHIRTSR